MKSRPPRPLRRAPTRGAVRRVAVFTEGAKTEPGYLIHWHRAYRDQVQVDIEEGLGAPVTIVNRAVHKKRAEARDAKRGRGRASDEYWCVFDVDQHPNVGPAIEKALANGISVAVSNPCIELWFVLHFRDHSAHIERSDAQAVSKELLKCGKVLNDAALGELIERFPEAKVRAVALDNKHLGDGRPARSNPSSGMWRLIDRIAGDVTSIAGDPGDAPPGPLVLHSGPRSPPQGV